MIWEYNFFFVMQLSVIDVGMLCDGNVMGDLYFYLFQLFR